MAAKLLGLEPQRRDAILNAALKEFTQKGFDDASTNVIAKDSGISKALMFHYVNNKQELLLVTYDYFIQLLDNQFFAKMNFLEPDIFGQLRQSYLLQIDLIKQYPWIFELNKLSATTKSDEINKELEKRAQRIQLLSCDQMFENIDIFKFKTGLNIELCKKFIIWSNIGFTNQILDQIRNTEALQIDSEHIISLLDEYFDELRKIFYS